MADQKYMRKFVPGMVEWNKAQTYERGVMLVERSRLLIGQTEKLLEKSRRLMAQRNDLWQYSRTDSDFEPHH